MKGKILSLANNKLSQFWENQKKGLGTVFSRVIFDNKISIIDNFDQDLVVAWHNWHCPYLLESERNTSRAISRSYEFRK